MSIVMEGKKRKRASSNVTQHYNSNWLFSKIEGTDATSVEQQRVSLQYKIDEESTADERNRLGQVATPVALAQEILSACVHLIPERIRFLEPAIGTGALYSALLTKVQLKKIDYAEGYEKDSTVATVAKKLWSDHQITIIQGDFLASLLSPERSTFNVVFANPPYVRHHYIAADEKDRLTELVNSSVGIRPSKLCGLYVYFMLATHAWMSQDALAIWIVPSEFMSTNYGTAVQTYLTTKVTLNRIHCFPPGITQFHDVLVTSAIVVFQKRTPEHECQIEFTFGESVLNPTVKNFVPLTTLKQHTKWNKFFQHSTTATEIELPLDGTQTIKLKKILNVKRGIATGNNQYFVLSPEQIAQHQIPAEFLQPVIPSSRYLQSDEIAANGAGEPILSKKLFLINCNIPLDTLRNTHPSLWKYFLDGEKKGIHNAYLCSHRQPWYKQDKRDAPLFLLTYMGRRTASKGTALHFILNRSKAVALNNYLLLYPQKALSERQTQLLWTALKAISNSDLNENGRVYGGGLHKLEPNELLELTVCLPNEFFDLF